MTGWSTVMLCNKSPKQEAWNKRKLSHNNLEKNKKCSHFDSMNK